MKKYIVIFSVFFLGCAAGIPSRSVPVETFIPTAEPVFQISDYFPEKCEWMRLVQAVDGDTIEVSRFWIFGTQKVRFIGIDTPETKHPSKPVQPFGPEASAQTKSFLAHTEKVCLISDPKADSLDKYGRLLAYVFSEQGMDVNAELLKLGLARGYFYFPFSRKEEFRTYEKIAQEKGLGVWGIHSTD